MTSKRFHKLFRSEMTKLMAHKQGANMCIKAAANARPFRADGTSNAKSYKECWDALRAVFTYGDNIPPIR